MHVAHQILNFYFEKENDLIISLEKAYAVILTGLNNIFLRKLINFIVI